MNSCILPPGTWAPARFWSVTGILFILQVGLIWGFAERNRKPVAALAGEFAVRLLPHPLDQGQLATALFAEDPTLFQAASRRGFSGRAWMATPSPEYHAAETAPAEVWLSMTASGWRPDLRATNSPDELSIAPAPPHASEAEASSLFLGADNPPARSALRMAGALRSRRLVNAPSTLPVQASAQLLSNSVVQVAVDASGQVLTACLIRASGLPAADATALSLARALRFEPLGASLGAPAWGEAVFSWQTVEPASAPPK